MPHAAEVTRGVLSVLTDVLTSYRLYMKEPEAQFEHESDRTANCAGNDLRGKGTGIEGDRVGGERAQAPAILDYGGVPDNSFKRGLRR